jgi:hypothetical protein
MVYCFYSFDNKGKVPMILGHKLAVYIPSLLMDYHLHLPCYKHADRSLYLATLVIHLIYLHFEHNMFKMVSYCRNMLGYYQNLYLYHQL